MYKGIDYEGNSNAFDAIKNLNSTLKYGCKEAIPHPWITVFIPTYKRESLLKEAINSVLYQDHCDFEWDIIVVDNDADNGKQNDTERLIRKINSKRILYYRNNIHVRPGDNFNNGLMIARGEWVCFLHDDDILISNTLQKIGNYIKHVESYNKKPLGAISARYHQFSYNPDTEKCTENIFQLDQWYKSIPINYGLYRLTHSNVWFTSNIGGDVPSNGTTFNKAAALKSGGFNEDFGISGDLILFYRMENNYSVYASSQPLGFYRWGSNTMIKPESTRRVITNGNEFREYIYHKNLIGRVGSALFRKCHTLQFETEVIDAKNRCLEKKEKIVLDDYRTKTINKPTRLGYWIYINVLQKSYYRHKKKQCEKMHSVITKQIQKDKKIKDQLL